MKTWSYGLRRRQIRPGVYEKVKPEHSWNASPLISNLFLFELQRHADHHAHPNRPYQSPRNLEGGPQLPAGYASLIPMTLIPPLWRRLIHPRLPNHAQ